MWSPHMSYLIRTVQRIHENMESSKFYFICCCPLFNYSYLRSVLKSPFLNTTIWRKMWRYSTDPHMLYFGTVVRDGSKWSASRFDCFTSRESANVNSPNILWWESKHGTENNNMWIILQLPQFDASHCAFRIVSLILLPLHVLYQLPIVSRI
jgi:hypothetical protein